jgi:hypothetical protein
LKGKTPIRSSCISNSGYDLVEDKAPFLGIFEKARPKSLLILFSSIKWRAASCFLVRLILTFSGGKTISSFSSISKMWI